MSETEKNPRRWIYLLIIAAVVLGGASLLLGIDRSTPSPTAEDMLPDMPGYNVVEGESLTDYVSTVSGGAALLAGQPELALLAAGVDHVVSCYQDAGAIQTQLYSDQAQATSAGVVAIADRNALLDPETLFACFTPIVSAQDAYVIQPCMDSYQLVTENNVFYVAYAGTTQEICAAFCEALEGCEEHLANATAVPTVSSPLTGESPSNSESPLAP